MKLLIQVFSGIDAHIVLKDKVTFLRVHVIELIIDFYKQILNLFLVSKLKQNYFHKCQHIWLHLVIKLYYILKIFFKLRS